MPMAVTPFTAGLLSAGFSAATGIDIRSPFAEKTSLSGEVASPKPIQLGIKHLFSATSMMYPRPPAIGLEGGAEQIQVYMLGTNKITSVPVRHRDLTSDFLAKGAAKNLGLPTSANLNLYCNGSRLSGTEKIKNLGSGSVICCLPGGGPGEGEACLDIGELDPSYDYDFRNRQDDGKSYMRGGYDYRRPYGWMRYAVRVLGEYGDDVWLGQHGRRTASTPGEWPVTYHGTRRDNLKPIVEDGYEVGPRDRFGQAVYSSPSLDGVAKHYSKPFDYEGKKYKLVLQNRVNADTDNGNLIIIPPERTGFPDFPYWLSPNQDPENGVYHARPYGVLVREV